MLEKAKRKLFLLVIHCIKGYQRWISPMLPPRCRFYPSCSQYTIDAVTEHGLLKGLKMGTFRLLRCHPLSSGGADPVPKNNANREL